MTSLLFKALIGALMVILMSVLAKTKNYYIAGLVPLFPTFALIAHTIVGLEKGQNELKVTALFGIFSVVPYLGYLISVYFFANKVTLWANLSISTLVWVILAFILILVWQRVMI
ncbi:MAG: GlpM family protein [Candidatus Marinarcus sp.]|uniref:GlpM family protein n=1 Tax=Candidatus Marinarcus sp. TaxID=3100987 RepID=UPI003AFFE446